MDKQVAIGRKLKQLREAAGLSQPDLAGRADTAVQNISRLERGERKLSLKWAELLAPHLGVDVATLMTDAPIRQDPRVTKSVSVPDLAIFGGMGGGGALEVTVNENGDPLDPEQVRGYWSFPEYMVRALGALKNIYAWEVRGDSMEPTLPGGSVVFVDTSQRTPPPDDIYAINYGDGLMVKRLKLIPRSDLVSVISDNERYGADDLPREEVIVWGRVVGWFQWRG